MFAMANWCLAVVQGAIWSWVPVGFPSLAIRPMANGGGCPKSLRWGARRGAQRVHRFPALRLETSLTAPLVQHHAVAGRQPCTWGVLANSCGEMPQQPHRTAAGHAGLPSALPTTTASSALTRQRGLELRRCTGRFRGCGVRCRVRRGRCRSRCRGGC